MYIVIGKSGQLAKELALCFEGQNITFLGRGDINLFNKSELEKSLISHSSKAIINTAAYTDVDAAERNQDEAFKLNSLAVNHLSELCSKHKIRLIHISTDFVFDGNKKTPYDTYDPANPINIYGKSKLAGEEALRKNIKNNFSIVRTSWLYSIYGKNFLKTMIKLMNERKEISVVDDQIGSPTYARGLANFLCSLIEKPQIKPIYHWSDIGYVSRYDFAEAIYEEGLRLGIIKDVELKPISSYELRSSVKRPSFSAFNPCKDSKIHWRDNLVSAMESLAREY